MADRLVIKSAANRTFNLQDKNQFVVMDSYNGEGNFTIKDISILQGKDNNGVIIYENTVPGQISDVTLDGGGGKDKLEFRLLSLDGVTVTKTGEGNYFFNAPEGRGVDNIKFSRYEKIDFSLLESDVAIEFTIRVLGNLPAGIPTKLSDIKNKAPKL